MITGSWLRLNSLFLKRCDGKMTSDLYAKVFFCAIIFALCMFDIFTIEEKYSLKRIMTNFLKSRNMELAWWIKHLPSKPTDHCLDSQHVHDKSQTGVATTNDLRAQDGETECHQGKLARQTSQTWELCVQMTDLL